MESTRALFFDEVRKRPRLVSYFGHSGTQAFGSTERLFTIEDLETTKIDESQPLFSNMTCLSSRFAVPGLVSLGKALLLDDQAAAAVWGPSGVSIDEQATLLARRLLNELSSGEETRIGLMINRAFPVLAEAECGREMIGIYHMFGDPALRVVESEDPGGPNDPTDPASTGFDSGGAGSCSVDWSRPSTEVPFLFLLSVLALAWRRRRSATLRSKR